MKVFNLEQQRKELAGGKEQDSRKCRNMKKFNMHMQMKSFEEEGQKNGGEKEFEEIIAEKLQGLVKNTILQIRSQVDPCEINANKITPRHIVVKLLKTKEKIFESIQRKEYIKENNDRKYSSHQ